MGARQMLIEASKHKSYENVMGQKFFYSDLSLFFINELEFSSGKRVGSAQFYALFSWIGQIIAPLSILTPSILLENSQTSYCVMLYRQYRSFGEKLSSQNFPAKLSIYRLKLTTYLRTVLSPVSASRILAPPLFH